MKRVEVMAGKRLRRSPPARGRGLKRAGRGIASQEIEVAPRAGAWIETYHYYLECVKGKVAPRAGAWIETTGRGLR